VRERSDCLSLVECVAGTGIYKNFPPQYLKAIGDN
jgi:hypothetical protein